MKIPNHKLQITNKSQDPNHNKQYPFVSVIRSLYIVCNLVLVICILGINNFAYALSINIDPSNIRIVQKPGETKSGSIIVQNSSSAGIKLKAYTEDWVYAPDGSKSFIKPGSSVYSCSNWIVLDTATFELAPNEGKKISFKITEPKNSSGGHVSVVFFESTVDVREGIAVAGRIGTIIYQDTEGDIKRAGEIKDLSVLASEEGTPVSVKFYFQNNGNTHISARPKISITKDNKTVAETEIKPINTLPADKGAGLATFTAPLKEGSYKAQVELKFDDKTLKSQADFTIKKTSTK